MVKVGIFDSGIGGLSILKEIKKLNRELEIYYIADSAHNPYGNLTSEQILERSVYLTEKLLAQGCEQIVFACNTATAVAIDEVRRLNPQINFIGIEPYINVINQRTDLHDKRGVILVTPQTMRSQRFNNLKTRLDTEGVLDVFAPAALANIVERGFFTEIKKEDVLKEVSRLKGKYDFYILGCTHYPLIGHILKEVLQGEMISPCPMISKRLDSFLENHQGSVSEKFYYLNTQDQNDFKEMTLREIFDHMM